MEDVDALWGEQGLGTKATHEKWRAPNPEGGGLSGMSGGEAQHDASRVRSFGVGSASVWNGAHWGHVSPIPRGLGAFGPGLAQPTEKDRDPTPWKGPQHRGAPP